MFSTIRRHQSWLWIAIAVIVGLSLVAYINPAADKSGRGRSGDVAGIVGGRQVSQLDFRNAANEFRIFQFFQRGTWPDQTSTAVEYQTWVRLVLLEKMRQMKIDVDTDSAVAFAARQGYLGGKSFDAFAREVLAPAGLTADDFERFLRHEAGTEQLLNTAGISGAMVSPQQGEALYRAEHEDISTSAVFFSASNYLSSVKITNSALKDYFTNHIANYVIPDRVEISYVYYNVTNYFAAARTNIPDLDKKIEANWASYAKQFPEAKTPEEIKARLREEILRQTALTDAHRAAAGFAAQVDASSNKLATLVSLAARSNLTVVTPPPFSFQDAPTNLPPNFLQNALSRTPDEPLGGPLVDRDGVYILCLKRSLPHETPSLSAVLEKVTEDYKHEAALDAAREAVVKFSGALSNAVAFGRKFADFASESGVKAERLPTFSLATNSLSPEWESRLNFGVVQQAAFATPTGSASRPMDARDGYLILYVDQRAPVNEAVVAAELPRFLAALRDQRTLEAFDRWLGGQVSLDPDVSTQLKKLQDKLQQQSASGLPNNM